MMHSSQSYTALPQAIVPHGTWNYFAPPFPHNNFSAPPHTNSFPPLSSFSAPIPILPSAPPHRPYVPPYTTNSYPPLSSFSAPIPNLPSVPPHRPYVPPYTTNSYPPPPSLSCNHGFGQVDNTVLCHCNKHIPGVPFPKPPTPQPVVTNPNPYASTNNMSQGFFYSPLRLCGISTFCG